MGQDDLNERVLRHVSQHFQKILRVLRCVRFLAQLSAYKFKISAETVDLITSMSASLRELSVERIIVELDKTLSSANPAAGLANLPLKIETLIPDLEVVPDRFTCQSVDARLGECPLESANMPPALKTMTNSSVRQTSAWIF